MNESILKEDHGAIIPQGISFYNIENESKDVEVKNENGNIIKSDESYLPAVCTKLAYEIDVNEKPIKIQPVEIKLKEEIDIYDDPLDSNTTFNLQHLNGNITYKSIAAFCSRFKAKFKL